jgi:hypothetical protein
MRCFVRVKDKDDLYACVAVLEPDDVRAELDLAFRWFAQSLDMMLPDPRPCRTRATRGGSGRSGRQLPPGIAMAR